MNSGQESRSKVPCGTYTASTLSIWNWQPCTNLLRLVLSRKRPDPLDPLFQRGSSRCRTCGQRNRACRKRVAYPLTKKNPSKRLRTAAFFAKAMTSGDAPTNFEKATSNPWLQGTKLNTCPHLCIRRSDGRFRPSLGFTRPSVRRVAGLLAHIEHERAVVPLPR